MSHTFIYLNLNSIHYAFSPRSTSIDSFAIDRRAFAGRLRRKTRRHGLHGEKIILAYM